ncbi:MULTISPECIES: hypothetical protein [Streptomyces rochei group]|uniref:hypothetical protein n=1 Tax=Streptomyces rochei group TaxID=2867164 RepID=UPI00187637AE|nr:hypothetical protein [Streptomyces vinaceusdrappus]GHC36872.1 hypothetical protein GCM10010308_64210 [Streptomyces vinaceusdrappus]
MASADELGCCGKPAGAICVHDLEDSKPTRDQLLDAVDKVRALHQPQQDGTGFPDSQQCSTCSRDGGDGYQYLVPWPCPTIRILGEVSP